MEPNSPPRCRFCNAPLKHTFADLGLQPICEHYPGSDQLNRMEPFYPLHVYFCDRCFLVQLEESIAPQEIFSEYAYFSSSSKGWMKHVETYAEMIVKKLSLSNDSQVVEIGSNDGYLLQFFALRNIPVLGVEPATNVAEEAFRKGVPTITKFFGKETSKELIEQNRHADLLIGNNILAQVPDINDFVEGLKILLKPSGVITMEFHHLMNLIDKNQFDTISHERFSHLSLFAVEKIFASHGLTIFDVEELSTHGGSLRIYARNTEDTSKSVTLNVNKLREKEKSHGLTEVEKYLSFSEKVKETKRNILDLLIKLKRNKKSIVGYGAHAEAHTFLNYCGITSDFLEYVVDRNPAKQGRFLAGVHIPIYHPDKISETKPDYVLILTWNIKEEIISQMSFIGNWGGQFIVSIPRIKLFNADGDETSMEAIIQETPL
jgi:2-polyprenyl-3-methyl-5-hydroxy-6-metoxy-1,4-benzoquinol methylase